MFRIYDMSMKNFRWIMVDFYSEGGSYTKSHEVKQCGPHSKI